SFDGIEVASNPGRCEGRRPAVVVARLHRDTNPALGAFGAPKQIRGENDVPVSEDISPDFDRLIDDALDRETAAIDQGINVLDIDTATGKDAGRRHADVRCLGSTVLLPSAQPARTAQNGWCWNRQSRLWFLFIPPPEGCPQG